MLGVVDCWSIHFSRGSRLMRSVAQILVAYLGQQLRSRLDQQGSGRTQLVFVGPPQSLLEEVFDLLTGSGAHDWPIAGTDVSVVVLLVGGGPAEAQRSALSARTNWDYVLTIRNESRASLVLVGPTAWDTIQDSIQNASEQLGRPRVASPSEFVRSEPWPYLLEEVERLYQHPAGLVARRLEDVFRDSRELSRRSRAELPWLAVDKLLAGKGIAESLGLPSLAPGIPLADSLKLARQSLVRLAEVCADEGFAEVEQKLFDARQERREREERESGSTSFIDEQGAIPGMFAYLRRTAGSAGALARSPSVYFQLDPGVEPWWGVLNNEALRDLLDAIEPVRPKTKLVLRVPSLVSPSRDEPVVVQKDVLLEVVERAKGREDPVDLASFYRRCPNGNEFWQDVKDGRLVDDQVPNHSKPIIYKASVPDHVDVTVKVISLDNFDCHGHVHVFGATRNPPPSRRSRGRSPFEQVIVMRQAGVYRAVVLVASEIARVGLEDRQSASVASPVVGNQAEFTVYLEDNAVKTVVLLDASGTRLGSWELAFQVEESTQGVVSSRFDDLVLSHQELRPRQRIVLAKSCQLRSIETQILESDRGNKGLLACWASEGGAPGEIDWETARVGDTRVPDSIDARPPAARSPAPVGYLSSREAVRRHLGSLSHEFVSEKDLTGEEMIELASTYLAEYQNWLRDEPEAAAWTDCVALYINTTADHGGVPSLTNEPVALLLTPIHPLRLAWHVHAQSVLRSGLDRPCPLAGLLSPHLSPSITGVPIWLGTQVDWRPFVTMPSDDQHWSVLVNDGYLRDSSVRAELFAVLVRLGLTPQGVTGGMSVSQAKRALDDMGKILATKATLRVGLVGSPHEEAGSVEGLVQWVERGFRPVEGVEDGELEDGAELTEQPRPWSVEVFDFRQGSKYPSEALLANLSEDVGGKLRWFVPPDGRPALDLIIFDQVETTGLKLEEPDWTAKARSVLGNGALVRLHIREDQAAGRVIGEARIGRQKYLRQGLEGSLLSAHCAFEELAMRAHATHLVFEPNRQALDGWIDRARFLSATSSQIDPACFIRGSGRRGDYLWDYDLPSSAGIEAGAAGYYLIARPRDAMKDSVSRSLAIVSTPPPPVDPVLQEISRRGIPVLKRLATGGSRSRGEIGVLLAVRLLQDAFRPETTGIRLPVVAGNCVHMILAVDSYRDPFDRARKAIDRKESLQRADLLVFAVKRTGSTVNLKITPLEVKFFSTRQNRELTEALEQANHLGRLLRVLWVDQPFNPIWQVSSRALLAECLDECFRIYADPALHGRPSGWWTELHEETLHAVLGIADLSTSVSVNPGRVLAFGPAYQATRLSDMDGDAIHDTLTVSLSDAQFLLTANGSLSPEATDGLHQLDLSHVGCEFEAERTTSPAPKIEALRDQQGPKPSKEALPVQVLDDDTVPDVAVAEEEPGPEVNEDLSDVAQQAGGISVQIRKRVRDAFSGFIGNDKPVQRISRDVLVALTEDPPSLKKNYLLIGLPSVGKTELARRIASALQLPFVRLDGPSLSNREKLFELIDGELGTSRPPQQVGTDAGQPLLHYPPFVVLVDEIHLVPQKVQESLLTMLEAADHTVRLTGRVALVPTATFIFATTQQSKVDKAFRSRCTVIELQPYSVSQVAEMVRAYLRSSMNTDTWDGEIFPRIARLGRLVPRRAFEVGRELMDELRATEHPEWSMQQHLDRVRSVMEIDENGLRRLDLQYLDVLVRADRPLGEDAVATMLGTVDKDEILEDIEPVLRRLGLIYPSARGREITEAGREYLAAHRYSEG
jgi:Holliday junction resolvasome RuvABC ATP-dependent DNA helicase subunit